ncbi:hypothetical protein SAMN05518672_109109 [Chitinophaga sp. CF118]|nr:hypothetical protein SAMN05518672_109109 [Chitinophaga sp. CF118]
MYSRSARLLQVLKQSAKTAHHTTGNAFHFSFPGIFSIFQGTVQRCDHKIFQLFFVIFFK